MATWLGGESSGGQKPKSNAFSPGQPGISARPANAKVQSGGGTGVNDYRRRSNGLPRIGISAPEYAKRIQDGTYQPTAETGYRAAVHIPAGAKLNPGATGYYHNNAFHAIPKWTDTNALRKAENAGGPGGGTVQYADSPGAGGGSPAAGSVGPGGRGGFSGSSPLRYSGPMEVSYRGRRVNPNGMVGAQADVSRIGAGQQGQFRVNPNERIRSGRFFQAPDQGLFFSGPDARRGIPGINDFGGDTDRMESATFERGMNLLRPGQEREQQAMNQRLADQGLVPGSEAYNAELERLSRQHSSARENLALSSVGAGRQEHGRLTQLAQSIAGQGFNQDLASRGFSASEQGRRFSQGLAGAQFDAGESGRRFQEDLAGNQADFGQRFASSQFDASESSRRFNELMSGQAQQHGLNQVNRQFAANERGRDFGERLASEGQFFGQNLAADQFASQAHQYRHGSNVQQNQFTRGLDQADRHFGANLGLQYAGLDQADRHFGMDFGLRQQGQQWNQNYADRDWQRQGGWADRDFGLRQQGQQWNQGFQDRQLAQQGNQWQQGHNLARDQFGFQQTRANVGDQQWQQQFDRSGNQWNQDFGLRQQDQNWNQQFMQNDWDRSGDQWQQGFDRSGQQWDQDFGLRQQGQNWNQQFARDQFNTRNDQWQQQFDREGNWWDQSRDDQRRGSMWNGIGQLGGALAPWLMGGGGGGEDAGGGGKWGWLGKGIGAALPFLGMFSDERMKDDHGVVDVVPIHRWNYKGDGRTFVGPMAQDVERVMPRAVGADGAGRKILDLDALAGVMAA